MTILEMWEWSTHLHWQHQLWRHLSVSARVDEIQLLKCARRQYAWKPCKFKQCSMKWWRTRQLQRQPWSGRRCRTHKLHANKLRCICLQCVAWIPRNTKRILLSMKSYVEKSDTTWSNRERSTASHSRFNPGNMYRSDNESTCSTKGPSSASLS